MTKKLNHRNTTVAQLQEGAVVSIVVHRVLTVDELLWSEFKKKKNTIYHLCDEEFYSLYRYGLILGSVS